MLYYHVCAFRDNFGDEVVSAEYKKKEDRDGDQTTMSLREFVEVIEFYANYVQCHINVPVCTVRLHILYLHFRYPVPSPSALIVFIGTNLQYNRDCMYTLLLLRPSFIQFTCFITVCLLVRILKGESPLSAFPPVASALEF